MTRRGRGRSIRWLGLAAPPVLGMVVLLSPGHPAERSARRHEVEIRGMAFHPAHLEVAAGDTVVWINRDIVPHTASAVGGQDWDTSTLAVGDSGRLVMRTVGNVSYVCNLHPTMQGRLTIR